MKVTFASAKFSGAGFLHGTLDAPAFVHTVYGMKMTLNIDDELLDRVMKFTGAKTKTEVIDNALKEMDRRATLSTLLADDFGMTSEDWKNAIDPGYDLAALRVAETPKVTKTIKPTSVRYARKSRAH